jgi:hypothetical protein
VFPIEERHRRDNIPAAASRELILLSSDNMTGGRSLEIPFSRSVRGVVKVMETNDEVALGSGKHAKVQNRTITTGLHLETGGRKRGQIASH